METGLEGKPWYVAGAIALGLVIAIVVLAKYVKIDDMDAQIGTRESKLAELEQKITEGRSAQASLPQFREEVRRLELELEKLLRILPTRRNMDDLLRRIRALTEQGNFVLNRVTPKGLSRRDFYSEWPIDVRLDGGYHNLALFFDRISRFSRIINVEGLQIQAAKGEGHTISTSFTVKTFLYNEPPPEGEAIQ